MRTGRVADAKSGAAPLALPPPGGWTLLDAAAALCPEQAKLFNAGGAPLEAVIRASMGGWGDLLDPSPDAWLADMLLAALCSRLDLVLTGRDLTEGMHAPRFRLPPDAMVAALSPKGGGRDEARVYLTLRLTTGRAEIAYSFPEMRPNLPADFELIEARIEAALPSSPDARPQAAAAVPADVDAKPPYSAEAAKRWLGLRVETWPAGKKPSTGALCLAAAREFFGSDVPRDPFLALRRDTVPDTWQARGPR